MTLSIQFTSQIQTLVGFIDEIGDSKLFDSKTLKNSTTLLFATNTIYSVYSIRYSKAMTFFRLTVYIKHSHIKIL